MKLSDINLTLFFTGGIGLKTWFDVGNLDREIALYKRLREHLGAIRFITYGGKEDRNYSHLTGEIDCYPITWHRYPFLTVIHLLLNYYKILNGSNVFKTNQILGSQVPITLKKIFGKKLIVRCGYLHGRFSELRGKSLKEINLSKSIEQRAFKAADIGIVPTERDLEWVVRTYGTPREKLRVIPNYVDVDIFAPDESEKDVPFDLVFVGRSARQKNLKALLDALAILIDRSRNVRLLLIGDGAHNANLRNTVNTHRLEVSFLENIPNTHLPQYLNSARAFILPSFYEGHPKALIEAMSCGMPCIGANVEGISDIIRHKETGYLCGTDAESIANAIENVLSDNSLAKKMGENARDYVVEKFSLNHVLERELDVLKELAYL